MLPWMFLIFGKKGIEGMYRIEAYHNHEREMIDGIPGGIRAHYLPLHSPVDIVIIAGRAYPVCSFEDSNR